MTCPLAGGGEGTGGVPALLEVEAPATTSHTQRVSLVPPLTEASCSSSLQPNRHNTSYAPICIHRPIHLTE